MTEHNCFADAYKAGLKSIIANGASVTSVVDPLSKASNFGKNSRPSRELLAHSFKLNDPLSVFAFSPAIPLNLPYCFGLLAWSLDGRNDVETLAYYRQGANEYSDDQYTLSGAFGHRLFSVPSGGNQLFAILKRIQSDPSHRRTFALVLDPSDNFRTSREYPCAAGVQLFLRDDQLVWLTVMRAQQALTVLPYDAFLFMMIQQYAASLLEVPCGAYIHQSGTFHFYENEENLASKFIECDTEPAGLPPLPGKAESAREEIAQMIDLERKLREAAVISDFATIDRIAAQQLSSGFTDVVRACLATYAYRKLGDEETLVESHAASRPVAQAITEIRAASSVQQSRTA